MSLPAPDELKQFLDQAVSGSAVALTEVRERLGAVEPGVPVLIALPNGKPLLTAIFAVLLGGGVPVPMAPASSAARVITVARQFGAGALIAPRIDPLRYGSQQMASIGDADVLRFPWPERTRHSAGDLILMTSGTSGLSSGCLHRIDSLLLNARRHADAIGQRPGDTLLLNLPMHFSYALVAQALAALVRGSRLIISGPPFTSSAYYAALAEHRVTVSSLTPVLAARLDHALPQTLRALTVGGDAFTVDGVRKLRELKPELELYLTYGLTEAGPRVATLAAHREPEHRYGSVGRPLDGVRTHLRSLPDGGQELLVESETVLRQRVPAGPDPLVAPGIIATGDLFEIDADGYHYFKGRLSDSVTVNGEKVWLPSVREIAASVPGVHRSATRVYQTDDGQRRYDLDVFVHDPTPARAGEVERALNQLLLRGERPHRITLRPVSEAGWHK